MAPITYTNSAGNGNASNPFNLQPEHTMTSTKTLTPYHIQDPELRPWILDKIFSLTMSYLRLHGSDIDMAAGFIYELITDMSDSSFWNYNADLRRCIRECCAVYAEQRADAIAEVWPDGDTGKIDRETHTYRRFHAQAIRDKIEELISVQYPDR